jgi:hypothetical protein
MLSAPDHVVRHEGDAMTASGFTRVGGIGALIGGVLWVASFGAAQGIAPAFKGLLVGPVLMLLLALAALQARHAMGSGRIGKAGFGLALVGLVLVAYGAVGHATISGDIGGRAFGPLYFAGVAPGAFILGAGAVLTALSMIRANVLPRLSPIPLLVGSIGVAVAGGIALGRQLVEGVGTDVFPLPIGPLAMAWALFGLGWLWVGYLLWSERTPGAERARAALRAAERGV